MLAGLQRRLVDLYDLRLGVEVEDFVCDEQTARSLGGEEAARRGEVLFVVERADGAEVALWIEPGARSQRGDGWLGSPGRFRRACLAAEGVSHFVFVAFRADHALETSELELELQAEIDKWALGLLAPWRGLEHASLLAGRGTELVRLRDRSQRLRERLFSGASFLDAAGTERGERYREASRLAERYALQMERAHVLRGDLPELGRELRRFYRVGLREKIERIGG